MIHMIALWRWTPTCCLSLIWRTKSTTTWRKGISSWSTWTKSRELIPSWSTSRRPSPKSIRRSPTKSGTWPETNLMKGKTMKLKIWFSSFSRATKTLRPMPTICWTLMPWMLSANLISSTSNKLNTWKKSSKKMLGPIPRKNKKSIFNLHSPKKLNNTNPSKRSGLCPTSPTQPKKRTSFAPLRNNSTPRTMIRWSKSSTSMPSISSPKQKSSTSSSPWSERTNSNLSLISWSPGNQTEEKIAALNP